MKISDLFRFSLRKKMIFIMAGVVIFSTTATTLISSAIVSKQFDDQIYDRASKSLKLVKKLIRDSQERVRSLALNLASLSILQADLDAANEGELRNLLESTKNVFNVDQISVYDKEGHLFVTTGRLRTQKPIINSGNVGVVEQFGFTETQEGLFLFSAYPVKHESGYLLGRVEVKLKINQSYLDEIKVLSGSGITVFYGNGQHSTTLSDEEFQRLNNVSSGITDFRKKTFGPSFLLSIPGFPGRHYSCGH